MGQNPPKVRKEAGSDKEERLAALFDSCYPRVARYAYARIGDRTDAEDIAAETFLRDLDSLDRYQERGLPMEAWLFRIAHNLVVDHLRRANRFERAREDEELQSSDNPAHVAEERILLADTQAAMEQLTQDQKNVLTLRFFGGLSSKETAATLQKSDGAVREMQRAALERLRTLLR